MASYQDIETRLETVERKLDFLLKTGRMKVALNTGVLDSQGRPTIKHFEGSLLEIYHLANQVDTKLQSEQVENDGNDE